MPNAINKALFELCESYRQIDDRKWHCIDLILCHLRSSIFDALTCSNRALFIAVGINLMRYFFILVICSSLGAEESPLPEPKTTSHQGKIGGKVIDYEATAGFLSLKDDKGKETGNLFYVAYTKKGEKDTRKRPLTFCFNGGPGSSSLWLHLGAFGPRKVVTDTTGQPLRPVQLEDNEFSILDLTDLVFVDPMSTGFSCIGKDCDPKTFHGVKEDIEAMGLFIHTYLSLAKRWDSPKFIAGESYGTARAAGLAYHLKDKYFIDCYGLLFISTIIDFYTVKLGSSTYPVPSDLPFIMTLPSYTMTAWYHKKLPKDLLADPERARRESEEFAFGDYALALLQGDRLSKEKQEEIAEKLERYTGLSKEELIRSRLRPNLSQFSFNLLQNKERVVGRFDSRFTGISLDPVSECQLYDPSFEALAPAFTAGINTYLEKELGWEGLHPYRVFGDVRPWNWGSTPEALNLNQELFSALTVQPHLRVFAASGFYDLAAPYFGARYTFSHLGLDPEIRGHIIEQFYDAGHMMYIHKPSLVKLKRDLVDFYSQSL